MVYTFYMLSLPQKPYEASDAVYLFQPDDGNSGSENWDLGFK